MVPVQTENEPFYVIAEAPVGRQFTGYANPVRFYVHRRVSEILSEVVKHESSLIDEEKTPHYTALIKQGFNITFLRAELDCETEKEKEDFARLPQDLFQNYRLKFKIIGYKENAATTNPTEYKKSPLDIPGVFIFSECTPL
ncbi:Oidioi.mRNA.OKI2018_I69.chr1.g2760.t1.cds [Oikopleura dioica]|uniref:Oidioi.mRNA.OKI2018_I69.chr1.g2760.t1.cds n=1 Tax=Oikopleura dioica TaxID=34765 RepID=A0ABN7SWB1_OIKDI|nr:Oidioi.mRNA.OKI2018_I69.chr1.g2760.t1.cds [Oikopleura dioica]